LRPQNRDLSENLSAIPREVDFGTPLAAAPNFAGNRFPHIISCHFVSIASGFDFYSVDPPLIQSIILIKKREVIGSTDHDTLSA
jgi:hypothetical protein